MSWTRRAERAATRLASDTLGALRVGVVVLDANDQPVLVNPAAVDLGLIRIADGPQQVHPVLRTLAGLVRRGGERREVELDLPRGPEGGSGGGRVVAEGPPEHVATVPVSYTGKFLAELLG